MLVETKQEVEVKLESERPLEKNGEVSQEVKNTEPLRMDLFNIEPYA